MQVSLGRALWIGLATAFGLGAASMVGRLSDVTLWQVLPWILLAGFWTFLLLRYGKRSQS